MKKAIGLSFLFAALGRIGGIRAGHAQAQEAPKVAIPQSGVPQIMTMEGKFVRAAYNNEGYVILGYQVVNRSIGEEWVLLEIGIDGPRRRGGVQTDARVTSRWISPTARQFRCQATATFVRRTLPRCRIGLRCSVIQSTIFHRVPPGRAASDFSPS